MKNLYLIALCLTLPYLSFAQIEWAPVGAVWHINEAWFFDPPDNPLFDFYTLESSGDTAIGGYAGRKVGDYITVQDGARVYLWWGDTLNLIFDYSLEVGDSAVFNLLSCDGVIHTNAFRVDSIVLLEVDNLTLRHYFTHFENATSYYDYDYIEKIGHPEVGILNYAYCAFTTDHYPAWMRCYRDNAILYRSERFEMLAPGAPCDVVSSLSALPSGQIGLFPNPANSGVTLTLPQDLADHDLQVALLSPLGNVLVEQQCRHPSLSLDLSGLPPGLIFVLMRRKGSLLGVSKLVIR
jgi:hypothetical protein